MRELSKTERRVHGFIISCLLSLVVWIIINYSLVKISLFHYIIIEISIGIGELFSIFIKEKIGINRPTNQQ
jgi:hypothetical protein